jgi:hypothetical protein
MMIEKIEERLTEVRSEIEQTKVLLKQMEAGTLTLHEAKGSVRWLMSQREESPSLGVRLSF